VNRYSNAFIGKLGLVFSAGAAGALANSLTVWLFGWLGVTTALGVAITPHLSPGWLYPRIVWGGLWGILFLLPIADRRPILKGLLISMGPTLVQLLIIFPFKASKGFGGIELGLLTPLFVVLFNAVWGLVAVAILRWSGWIGRAGK